MEKDNEMTPNDQRAYELRLSGKTFKEIAKELNYADPSGAYQAYQRAREVISLDNLGEFRLLELERLSVLQSCLWDKAMEGSGQALSSILKIMDLRARLIGLYAPEKHEIKTEQEDTPRLKETYDNMMEMIALGVKFAEEKGISTPWMVQMEEKKARDGKVWDPGLE
jgi:hypothetical protein